MGSSPIKVVNSELAQRKRVGLITQRSEDRNLYSLVFQALLAQLAARRSHNPKVASSILAEGICVSSSGAVGSA